MNTKPETALEIIARYRKAYDKREERICDFLNDGGDLKEGVSQEAYDEARIDEWEDSHGDLGSLVSELEAALGARLKLGDRVIVSAEAETASGGAVLFTGEVKGTLVGPRDGEGDVKVEAQGGIQYVDPRFVKPLAE
ncbi:hypothetical protein [Streptomyces sp. NRRL F-5123]|uniref:hypothetical protein n=1 Tax=Streptomyces sp. NRRL F-5123 TaxID=1463856 RepID=UPI00069388BD|nr:hypothetical protein [Streptomyces sp. NRRL F-5123]